MDQLIIDWLVENFIPKQKREISSELWKGLLIELQKNNYKIFSHYSRIKKYFEEILVLKLDKESFGLSEVQKNQLKYGRILNIKKVEVKFVNGEPNDYILDLSPYEIEEIKGIVRYFRFDEFSESCLLTLQNLQKSSYVINVNDQRLDLNNNIKRKLMDLERKPVRDTMIFSPDAPSYSQTSNSLITDATDHSENWYVKYTENGTIITVSRKNSKVIAGHNLCKIFVNTTEDGDLRSVIDSSVAELSSIYGGIGLKLYTNNDTQIIEFSNSHFQITTKRDKYRILIPRSPQQISYTGSQRAIASNVSPEPPIQIAVSQPSNKSNSQREDIPVFKVPQPYSNPNSQPNIEYSDFVPQAVSTQSAYTDPITDAAKTKEGFSSAKEQLDQGKFYKSSAPNEKNQMSALQHKSSEGSLFETSNNNNDSVEKTSLPSNIQQLVAPENFLQQISQSHESEVHTVIHMIPSENPVDMNENDGNFVEETMTENFESIGLLVDTQNQFVEHLNTNVDGTEFQDMFTRTLIQLNNLHGAGNPFGLLLASIQNERMSEQTQNSSSEGDAPLLQHRRS